MNLMEHIRNVPDYPKKGIQFKDITTLFNNAEAFKYTVDQFKKRYENHNLTAIVGVESRGFILGSAIAYALGLRFVPIRKKGKLPSHTISQDYELEYGSDTLEIHTDALSPEDNVIIIDDLLATGGTIFASIQLVERLNAKVDEVAFVIDLPELKGSEKLKQANYKLFKLIDFDGI